MKKMLVVSALATILFLVPSVQAQDRHHHNRHHWGNYNYYRGHYKPWHHHNRDYWQGYQNYHQGHPGWQYGSYYQQPIGWGYDSGPRHHPPVFP